MEIGVWGIVFLLFAWGCTIAATGFGFYLYSKNKDYTMSQKDNSYLLVTCITSAVAVGLTTLVTLMIIFFGRQQYKNHAIVAKRLMMEKMDLENQVADLNDKISKHNHQSHRKVLENPIPLRKGKNGRPLIT